MEYKYDYYVAYGVLPENASDYLNPELVKVYNDFVDAFISKLKNSSEFQTAFGRKARVFCSKNDKSIEDWDRDCYPEMASSRLCVVLLSPLYFRKNLCGYEFTRWLECEVNTRLIGESVVPMYMFGYSPDHCNFINDVYEDFIEAYPCAAYWAAYLNEIAPGETYDMHDFQTSRIDAALHNLIDCSKRLFEKQDKSEDVPCNSGYPPKNDHYIAQHSYLYKIRNALHNSESKKSILLYGLDGVGKTETALAYGFAYAWDYGLGRIFVSGEKKASLKSVLLKSGVSEMFGWSIPSGTEDEQFAFLVQKLQEKHDEYAKQNPPIDGEKSRSYGNNMLLILDDVNEPELVSEKNLSLLPDFVHVIATARRTTSQCSHLLNLPLLSLMENEAIDLLKSYRPFTSEEDIQCARKIAEHFAGFPAPLAQIGFYLQENKKISCSEFYARLADYYDGVLQMVADYSHLASGRPSKSVVDSMKKAYGKLSPNAQMFLEFTEVLSYDAVPVPWIRDCWGIDEKLFEDAVEELKGCNILSFDRDNPHLGKVNPLIMRYKTHKQEQLVFEKAPMLFNRSSALLGGDFLYWASGEKLWELEAIDGIYTSYMNSVNDIQKVFNLRLPDQFFRIGQIYKDLNIYNKAKQIFTKNVKLCYNILDVFPDDIQTQKWLSNSYERLGNITYNNGSGNVNEAKQWYEAELEIDKRLADAYPDDLVSQHNLGITYARMSDIEKTSDNYDNAFEWLQKALEHAKSLEKRFPPDNELVLGLHTIIYGRIADLERKRNHNDKAREWYCKSCEIDERVAKQDPNNTKKLDNLAVMCQKIAALEFDLSNFTEAVEWYKKSLDVRMRIAELIPNNMIVQSPIYNTYKIMAEAELNAGNVDNAEMYYEKELAVIKSLIESHPSDVSLKIDSGYAYLKLGDLNVIKDDIQKAQQLYQNATDDFDGAWELQSDKQNATYGLSQAYDKLGNLFASAGNTNDAIQFFQYETAALDQLLEWNRGNGSLRRMFAQAFAKLGALHSLNKDNENANKSMTIAIKILTYLVQDDPSNNKIQEEIEEYQRFMEDIDKKPEASLGLLSKLFNQIFNK